MCRSHLVDFASNAAYLEPHESIALQSLHGLDLSRPPYSSKRCQGFAASLLCITEITDLLGSNEK